MNRIFKRTSFWLSALILMCCAAGCGNRDAVQVQLHSRTSPTKDLLRLEIQAEVTGPTSGLRYKWFSVSGGCDPQESDTPATTFKFADNAMRDRVSVELWRNDKLVARKDLDVILDENRLKVESERVIGVKINITNVPPYYPYGGEKTHADIAGNVEGKAASECKVIIYARAGDTWYIQPMADKWLSIQPDNTWTSWTHTGSSYAALIVRPGYDAPSRLDILPPVGGYVVGRTVVEGKKDGPVADAKGN